MIFMTENSTYEVDCRERRIRRLEGSNRPTTRQGADGEWKRYLAISNISLGMPVIVFWRYADDGNLVEGTKTGPVRHITYWM